MDEVYLKLFSGIVCASLGLSDLQRKVQRTNEEIVSDLESFILSMQECLQHSEQIETQLSELTKENQKLRELLKLGKIAE